MKLRAAALLVPASVLLACSVSSLAGEAGRTLLAEVMEKPGGWRQMCSSLEPTPLEVPVPLYSGSLIARYFELGDKEAVRLQKQRGEVLPALQEAFVRINLARPPAVTRGWSDPGEGGGTRAGFKLDWLNPLHLRIVRELNAVETLPELLRLEQQLHELLSSGEKDARSPLPNLDVDASLFPVKAGAGDEEPEITRELLDSSEFKRDRHILSCRIFQRELLGTLTVLLRNEDFSPAKEKFEPLQRKAKARLADNVSIAKKELAEAEQKFAETKQEAEHEEVNGRQYELEEAVRKLGWHVDHPESGFESSYTPALRADIRTLAETFLKTVPPEKRRGAKAMPKHEEAKRHDPAPPF